MAAQIMESGDTESKIFEARGSFMLTVRAASGAIAGDWFLYYSADKDADAANWQKAHDTAFSDTYYSDIFDVADGLFFRLRGGTGTNIEAHFGHIVSIPQDKFDDGAAVLN